jgi:hypothetical protein
MIIACSILWIYSFFRSVSYPQGVCLPGKCAALGSLTIEENIQKNVFLILNNCLTAGK